MNKLNRAILASAMVLGGTSAFAMEGELLVSAFEGRGGVELVFEFLNEGDVAGVSFDIEFENSIAAESFKLDQCVAASKGSGLAGCNMINKNTLRVAISHPQLAELETGELGRVFVHGLSNPSFSVKRTRLVDATGKERSIEALTNVGRSEFEKPVNKR